MAVRTRPAPQIDEHYATEIRLFLDNDRELYDRKIKAFLPNIARKLVSGKYDASKAWKLWMYLVDEAVRKYDVEHGSGGKRVQRGWTTVRVGSLAAVDKPTREAVARELARDEEAALRGGEYGDLYTVAGRKPPKAKANGARSNRGRRGPNRGGLAHAARRNTGAAWDSGFLKEAVGGDQRYRYVPFHWLTAREQAAVRGRYSARTPGAKYAFRHEHYFYPVKADGSLADARRSLAIPIQKINDDAYMAALGYSVDPSWGTRKNAGSSPKDWKNKTSGPPYNGHPSYAHWNVALWAGNDEGLYRALVRMKKDEGVRFLMDSMPRTPDGVRMTKTLAAYAWRSVRE